MNTNKDIFYNNAKEYFGDNYDKFKKLLNEETTSSFFINEKKTNKENIFNLIDFEYKQSLLNDSTYYYKNDSIGKSKAYELGLIYPQDVESSLASKFVDIKDVKLVIDLCAAPGGKSINILNRIDDDALLIANEISYKRVGALVSNLERLGLSNTMITSIKPHKLATSFPNLFDLVILDAPCSGEGMIRKYPNILDEYSEANIDYLANIQKELLLDAYNLLKPNGQILYSTCTYSFKEDENQIIDFLNTHKDMKLIPIDNIKNNSSHLKGTLKLSPLNNTEGQFICLLKKDNIGDIKSFKCKKTVSNKLVEKFIKDNFDIDNYYLYSNEQHYYLSFKPLLNIENNVLCYGLYLGELKKDRFEPSHALYRSNKLIGKYKHVYKINDDEYLDYISGKELKANIDDGYYLISYKDLSLGYIKASKGTLKNKYPKGLRRVV